MSLKSYSGLDSGIDYDERLECFSKRKPTLFRKFINALHEKQLCRRLAEVAIENRILRPDINSKINNNLDGALYLMNEFYRVLLTVGLLHKCLTHHDFQHLSTLLGVFERICIIEQPGDLGTSLKTLPGGELKLTFLVKGCPVPSYQWFHNGSPIQCANESTLILSYFSKNMEGRYHCVAVQTGSNFSPVSLVSNIVECALILHEPSFLIDLPPEIVCYENEEVKLFVQPDSDYRGSYEWLFSKNRIVSKTNVNTLCIKEVTKHHEGIYRCVLKNLAGETYSNYCHLKVEPPLEPVIKIKVALLIGNGDYSCLSKLKTPSADVRLLAGCLKKMGFFVVSLINLNEKEFREIISWFHSIIPRKSVVLFFFSGHGFELMKNKFLLPVDCPASNKYTMKDCISYQYIIQQFIIKKPLLLILVLDMCLKGPDRENNPWVYQEHIEHYDYDLSNSSMIEACATSDNQIAYERSTDINGLYSRCLCHRIMRDLPILKNFDQAHNDFALGEGRRNQRQRPQLKYTNGPVIDFKLNGRTQRGLTRKMESKIVRSPSDFYIVELKTIAAYVLFVFIPDQLIVNSFDIYFLPLSDISPIQFTLICEEAHFSYEGTMSNESENIASSSMTISLNKTEAVRRLKFSCQTICDIETNSIYDSAEIVIKPILTFCNA